MLCGLHARFCRAFLVSSIPANLSASTEKIQIQARKKKSKTYRRWCCLIDNVNWERLVRRRGRAARCRHCSAGDGLNTLRYICILILITATAPTSITLGDDALSIRVDIRPWLGGVDWLRHSALGTGDLRHFYVAAATDIHTVCLRKTSRNIFWSNSSKHNQTSTIFGTNITERLSNQNCSTSPSSYVSGQTNRHTHHNILHRRSRQINKCNQTLNVCRHHTVALWYIHHLQTFTQTMK